jgi:hypothetical protein
LLTNFFHFISKKEYAVIFFLKFVNYSETMFFI